MSTGSLSMVIGNNHPLTMVNYIIYNNVVPITVVMQSTTMNRSTLTRSPDQQHSAIPNRYDQPNPNTTNSPSHDCIHICIELHKGFIGVSPPRVVVVLGLVHLGLGAPEYRVTA